MTAAESESLDRTVAADAASVGNLREEFSGWLRRFGLRPDRHNDLVLAVNEALANSAEFAYAQAAHPGLVKMTAWHDAPTSSITVTVTDQGSWREPRDTTTVGVPALRGRGIPLMRALADDVVIDPSPLGTTVRLRFNRVGDSVGDVDASVSVNA